MKIVHQRISRLAARISMGLFAVVMLGCASTPRDREIVRAPESEERTTLGDEVALRAIAQVGKPYRYGGADLDGFDCSGLVFFIHRDLGITVPRTAAEQYSASTPVNVRKLEPGDLLFFRMTKRKRVSHVAIYAGGGRFVHAPQSGRNIEIRELGDEYYGPHLVGAGRLLKNE
jgi:cell wall-associated NlpC family hydrolase